MSSFSTALSALQAASTGVSAVGHNLANLNTAGFKKSNITFQEMVSTSSNEGLGVSVSGQSRLFQQGPLLLTNRSLDAAIQGSGFFMLRPSQATSSGTELLLSRDGRFSVSAGGYLVSSSGARVQGWRMDTAAGAIPSSGPVQDLTVPLGTTLAARPTTRISITANLDAAAINDSKLEVPVELFDSQGNAHQFSVIFSKQAADTWSLSLATSDPAVQQPLPEISPSTLQFQNGRLVNGGSVSLGEIQLANGSPALGPVTWSLSDGDLTQYTQPAAILSVSQDGSPSATLSDVKIGEGGTVIGVYSNGREVPFARIALVGVRNPDSLTSAGGNDYRTKTDTFLMPPDSPDNQSYGKIFGAALEGSNADLAEQFTLLLTYQRGYQASARVITATDELTQEALTLLR